MNSNEKSKINIETLLKASDIAKMLNVSRSLAYRLIQTGEIPQIRINRCIRVLPEDLHDYIMEHKNNRNSAVN